MQKFLVAAAILFAVNCTAQKYNFKNYTVEQGLAQSQINDICQDELGYLWIATESGLSRFDGLNFVNFSMENGLPDNEIEKIHIDNSGVLWVGTPKGIAYFEDSKFVPALFSEQKRINDLESFKNEIYIATNSGLIKFAEGTFTTYLFTSEEDLYIRSLANYKDSILICGSKDGLYSWNDKYTVFEDSSYLELNVSSTEIQGSSLIISTYGDGLLNYNFENGLLTSYNLSLLRIRSVFADDEVILCSTINGAIEIKNGIATYFDESNGLINQRLRYAFRDRENNYWLGTDGNGLLKFLGKSIISYSIEDQLSSNLIMSIVQDETGNFIFGTYDEGITIFNKDSSKRYINEENGLPNNSVWSNFIDDKGRLWIATSRGVKCQENGKFVLENITDQIPSKTRAITQVDSIFFFGGTDGLYIYDGHSVRLNENTADLNINQLCYEDGTLYIAGRAGLYSLNSDDNFTHFSGIAFQEESINSIVCDDQKNLWIGTNNGLKIKMRNGIVAPIILDQQDFKSKTIFGLLKSKKNEIWVTTMNGVYQIIQSPLNEFRYRVLHYSSSEGLINLESNQNAVYEDDENQIWVGTSNGLARIDPSLNDELFDFKEPQLHFTGIRLFMEEFDYDRFEVSYQNDEKIPSSITLPYSQNHLTFDFIGINLKDPESVQYEYRLNGANYSWSPLSISSSATYSSISPGEYDFEVRATNKSFKWSNIKSIHITILPPFWKSWWFIILLAIVTGIIVLVIFQSRIRSIKQKQENEKLGYKNRLLFLEQQSLNASMNRHFIFNSLNSIQYFINSSDKLSANKYLSNFAKLIRKNLDSSTSNNFIVTLQEELDRIELYLTLEKMRFQEKFDYTLEVDSSLDTEGTEIPSMILQPFVENAIIHGVLPLERKGHISVKIYPEYDDVIFEVVDDGVGIDNTLKNKKQSIEGDHESKGMEITNRRIELLRKLTGDNLLIIGPFQLNNDAGEALGTKVIIKMGMDVDG